MRFVYEIPPHLEAYLGDMNEESIQKVMTMLIEFGVNHRLLDHPKLHIERQVDDTVSALSQLLSQSDKMMRLMTESMGKMDAQLERMSTVNVTTNTVVPEYETQSYSHVSHLDIAEEGDDEEYFENLSQAKKQNVEVVPKISADGTEIDEDTEELVDDLLA